MKIQLTIQSLVKADGDEQSTVQTVNGFLRHFDEYIELSYRESEGDDGLGNTLTTVRLYSTKMELIRRGDYTCVLTMETGNKHESLYQTPFGNLMLTTDTVAYNSTVDNSGHGRLTVRYKLSAAGGESEHELTIQVKTI